MFELTFAWALLLLPLPWLVKSFFQPHAADIDAIHAPFTQRLSDASGLPLQVVSVHQRRPIQRWLMGFIWIMVVFSMARPVWLLDVVKFTEPTRDLMIAVDISGSMATEDMVSVQGTPVSRLDVLKTLLKHLVMSRESDRFGLILFGSAPYLQVPFSQDKQIFIQLLNESQVPMAGPKTMLGDAIGLAVKHFKSSQTEQKALLLFTDGNDSGSKVSPLEAAEFAKRADIKVYTIAIGNPETLGEPALDLGLLKQIAQLTQGEAFQADSRNELGTLMGKIEELEPDNQKLSSYQPFLALYHWPLALALFVTLLTHSWLALQRWRTQ